MTHAQTLDLAATLERFAEYIADTFWTAERIECIALTVLPNDLPDHAKRELDEASARYGFYYI